MPERMLLRSGTDWHLDADGVDTFEAFLAPERHRSGGRASSPSCRRSSSTPTGSVPQSAAIQPRQTLISGVEEA